jgi:hypothetical protein
VIKVRICIKSQKRPKICQKRPNSSKYCTKKKRLRKRKRKRKRERFEKLYKIVQAVEKRKRKNKNLLAKKKSMAFV